MESLELYKNGRMPYEEILESFPELIEIQGILKSFPKLIEIQEIKERREDNVLNPKNWTFFD